MSINTFPNSNALATEITSADQKSTGISSMYSSLTNKQDNKTGCTEYTCQNVSGSFSLRGMTRHSASDAFLNSNAFATEIAFHGVRQSGLDMSQFSSCPDIRE